MLLNESYMGIWYTVCIGHLSELVEFTSGMFYTIVAKSGYSHNPLNQFQGNHDYRKMSHTMLPGIWKISSLWC